VATITVRRLSVGHEEVVKRLSLDDPRFEEAGLEPRARTPQPSKARASSSNLTTNVHCCVPRSRTRRRHGNGKMMPFHHIATSRRRDSAPT
jgi:hypothetical protein